MPRISALQQKIRAAATDEIPAVDTENGGTKKLEVAMIMPTGAILDYAGPNAPDGWLFCYGQTLNATTSPQYLPLYQAIGNTYGGSSLNDFVVPDLRGRVAAGKDNMGGSSADRLTAPLDGDILGNAAGLQTHTLTQTEMPVHDHGGRVGGTQNGDYWNVNDGSGGGGYGIAPANNNNGRRMTIPANGAGGAHNNLQPTIILNKIIKY